MEASLAPGDVLGRPADQIADLGRGFWLQDPDGSCGADGGDDFSCVVPDRCTDAPDSLFVFFVINGPAPI